MVKALLAGKLSSCRECAQRSDAQICFLTEDKGRKGPCPRSSVASVAHMLYCVDWSLRDPGYKMALSPHSWGQSPLWRPTLLSDPKILGVLGHLWCGESSGDCNQPLGSCPRCCWAGADRKEPPTAGLVGFLCPCSCWHKPLWVVLEQKLRSPHQ